MSERRSPRGLGARVRTLLNYSRVGVRDPEVNRSPRRPVSTCRAGPSAPRNPVVAARPRCATGRPRRQHPDRGGLIRRHRRPARQLERARPRDPAHEPGAQHIESRNLVTWRLETRAERRVFGDAERRASGTPRPPRPRHGAGGMGRRRGTLKTARSGTVRRRQRPRADRRVAPIKRQIVMQIGRSLVPTRRAVGR